HSNGYTLARRALLEQAGLGIDDAIPGVGRSVAAELLEPTRIYARAVLDLVREVRVRGMAHVTGGGITGNLPRVLPDSCRAVIEVGAWPVPPIFAAVQGAAGVDDAEMRRPFNMGLGFVGVTRAVDAPAAMRRLRAAGEQVFEVGEIRAGARSVEYV